MKYSAVILFALATFVSAQQAPGGSKDQAKTEIEAFAAQTGVVIIKGYTDLGRVTGMGEVAVDCREFTNAQTRKKSYGMVVKVTEAGRLEREDNSYIDYDEIPSLISGIDYISKINGDVTKLRNFEATYATRGDFTITVFNESIGKRAVAVSSGRIGRVVAYLKFEQLPELRSLIASARQKLDSIRATGAE